jgi:hypothetical protein
MRPHTALCVLILLYVSSCCCMCPHAAVCVLMLLILLYVSSYRERVVRKGNTIVSDVAHVLGFPANVKPRCNQHLVTAQQSIDIKNLEFLCVQQQGTDTYIQGL